MITLNEKIKKIIEAVHVLHQRDRKSKKNEHKAAKEPKKVALAFLALPLYVNRISVGLFLELFLAIFNILTTSYGPTHHFPLR